METTSLNSYIGMYVERRPRKPKLAEVALKWQPRRVEVSRFYSSSFPFLGLLHANSYIYAVAQCHIIMFTAWDTCDFVSSLKKLCFTFEDQGLVASMVAET